MKIAGSVVVITGGARGLGLAVAFPPIQDTNAFATCPSVRIEEPGLGARSGSLVVHLAPDGRRSSAFACQVPIV